jgi:flavorubredoxin
MRALIVFESMFGNTGRVARAVAEGFARSAGKPMLVDVGDAPNVQVAAYDMVVLGGPTHAFSMSRRSTRDDAVRQGASALHAARGIREWLAEQRAAQAGGPAGGPAGATRPLAAVFDTRVAKVRRLPGSAAKGAAKSLRALGYDLLDRPTSFYVTDVDGPLLDGEEERARAWGDALVGLAREALQRPA